MEAAEFAPSVKRLDYEDILSCRSDLLAAAFDDLHEALWGEKVPTDEDWMPERMFSLIDKGSQTSASLFPAPGTVMGGSWGPLPRGPVSPLVLT